MADPRLSELRRQSLDALRPPAKLKLSEWTEGHIYLPSSLAAQPGRMRLFPPQRALADAMGDPGIERVTVLKSARVGATQLMVAALGHYVENDPAPVLCVLPSETDARHLVTSIVEPTFDESPALRAALKADEGGRDTLYNRHFAGGSLTVVSAGSPRNLRARTARVLFMDEVDAYELSAGIEGDPVSLAIRRTQTFGDRKIVMASTPVDAETSRICAAYELSDQRVYEVPCPHCRAFHEVTWAQIKWEPDQPETAHWECPTCHGKATDRNKPQMVQNGRWRATRPDVAGHAGFKLTSLTSTLPNTSWPTLTAEFLAAKRNPATLKVFINTVLGEPWRDNAEGDLEGIDWAALQRPFDSSAIPEDVIVITAGADVQADRLEITLLGHTALSELRVIGHEVIWGSPTDRETWIELDELLRRQFRHPKGGFLTVDAAVIDSGSGGWTDHVYEFCRVRGARRVLAGKGMSGWGRPAIAFSQSRKVRLALIGVDGIKQGLHHRIASTSTVLFAHDLHGDYFTQLRGERLVTKFSRGIPTKRWETVSGRRNEALDCLAYAYAARGLVGVNVERREAQLADASATPAPRQSVYRSKWLSG